MLSRNALTAALVLPLLLAGCASASKTYPSLAIRDAERVSGTFAVAPPPDAVTPAPLRAEIAGQLDQILAEAQLSHRKFTDAAPDARRAIISGAGAAVASNAWAEAQIALGDLDSLRSVTAVALGDLDLLYADATLAFEDRAKVVSTRDLVLDIVRSQDRTLAQLRGGLAQ